MEQMIRGRALHAVRVPNSTVLLLMPPRLLFTANMSRHEVVPAAGEFDAPGSTESVQATLKQVNETARAAAEGSAAHAQHGSNTGQDEGQAEIQQMLDAMSQAMEGGGGEADSFVETLMHGLLSKEVLYDPLKVRTCVLNRLSTSLADHTPHHLLRLQGNSLIMLEALSWHNRSCDVLCRACRAETSTRSRSSMSDEATQKVQAVTPWPS